jgi:hydrogenase-4 component B
MNFLLLLFILPFVTLPISLISGKISYLYGIIFTVLESILIIFVMVLNLSLGAFTYGKFDVFLKGINIPFLFIILVVELLVNILSLYYEPKDKKLAFFVGLTIASIDSVLLSGNLILFLLFWESMTISGYLLIGFKKETRAYPPYVFISFGELSTLFLMAGFAAYYISTGSLSIGETLNNPFILFIIILGFIFKMGIVPLQMVEWLPIAHGNSPTPGSILFSAAMTTLALYGVVEFIITSAPSLTLGILLMIIGGFSLLFGSIFALSSENSKMLPAYSTVENSGALIILAGLLSVWIYLKNPTMESFVMLGILIYATAHAWAKSSIFILSAISEKHEMSNIEGDGLSKYARFSAAISAISLMGLAPLGGGIGEWLLLESLFITAGDSNLVVAVVAILVGGLAALGAGITIPAFTKYFNFTTRKSKKQEKLTKNRINVPLSIAGTLVLAISILAPAFVYMYSYFVGSLEGFPNHIIFLSNLKGIVYPFLIYSPSLTTGFFGFLSPPFDLLFMGVIAFILTFIAKGHSRTIPIWNGGLQETPEMNSFAYSNTIRIILGKIYFSKEEKRESIYHERTFDIFWILIVDFTKMFQRFSTIFGRVFMNGNINRYVQYIIIALFVVLTLVILP